MTAQRKRRGRKPATFVRAMAERVTGVRFEAAPVCVGRAERVIRFVVESCAREADDYCEDVAERIRLKKGAKT